MIYLKNSIHRLNGWVHTAVRPSGADIADRVATLLPHIFSQVVNREYVAGSHRSTQRRWGVGASIGLVLSMVLNGTGLSTGLHEVFGHGVLGYHTMYHYAPGQGPSYWVQGWDNFQKIGREDTVVHKVQAFFQWVIGVPSADSQGRAGYASRGNVADKTQLSLAIGDRASSAWISLAGSIPGLVLDTLLVYTGISLSKKSPLAGVAMTTIGMFDHVVNASYPISAAAMTEAEMKNPSLAGHDFANVARQLSEITGVSIKSMAVAVATLWTSSVPLAGVIAYARLKSQLVEGVSDLAAIEHIARKAKSDEKIALYLEQLYARYAKEAGWSWKRLMCQDSLDLLAFLVCYLPREMVQEAKSELIELWQEGAVSSDWKQAALTVFAVIDGVALAVAKALSLLVNWGAWSFTMMMQVFCGLSIAGAVIAVLSSSYQVYKDIQAMAQGANLSRVELFSLARLGLTIAASALGLVILLSPGVNVAMIGALCVLGLVNVLVNYARARALMRRFAVARATDPVVATVMQTLWRQYRRGFRGSVMPGPLKKWVDVIKSDNKLHHLIKNNISLA